MRPARWEGPGPSSTAGAHRVLAPWPTCSCLDCRRARAREDAKCDTLAEAVRRIRSQEIYPALRRDPDAGR